MKVPSTSKYKFDKEGNAIPYYGNTIISFLNRESDPIYQTACYVQEEMKKTGFARCLAFLPPSSFHMTVLSLCRERDRGSAYWPPYIPGNARFPEIDRILKEKAETVPFPDGIVMIFDECDIGQVMLRPYDEHSEKLIRGYRDQVSDLAGIKHPGHDVFRFHIGLDYGIADLSEEEWTECEGFCSRMTEKLRRTEQPFQLPKPDYVIFNNMLSYETDLNRRGPLY